MDANEMIENEQWTRGKMEVTDDNDLVVAGLEIASAIIDDIEGETPEALDAIDHANARRLAACWNSLANLTTAEIEQLSPDSIRVDALHAAAARIAIEVNEQLQRRIGELENLLLKASCYVSYQSLVDEIRAALALAPTSTPAFQLKYPPPVHGYVSHNVISGCTACDSAKYRIELWGDGAGVETVVGWAATVEHVTKIMFSPATDADRQHVLEMLLEGCDGDEGWNGERVHLQFEDGSLLVERLPYVALAPTSDVGTVTT